MNKSVILLSSLLLPTFAVAAPFCAVTGSGTYCGYYDVQTCQHAAGPGGACVANPNQGDGASRRPSVKFLEGGILTDGIRRNQEAAAKQRAEEQEAELRQLEIEQKRRELDRQKNEMRKQERQRAPTAEGERDGRNDPRPRDSSLILSCDIREAGRHEQVTVTVDTVNQTVDGWPARINEKFMVWESTAKNAKLRWLVNRFSGMVTVEGLGSVVYGQCEALTQEDRKF